MSRVLLIDEDCEPTIQETERSFRINKEKGLLEYRIRYHYRFTTEDIQWCDTIYAIRCTSNFDWRLARMAHKYGKKFIVLLDDDFLSLDKTYGRDNEGYWSGHKRALIKTLQHTDCLVAVNKLLAEKYTKIGNVPRYFLTNTAIDPNGLAPTYRNNDRTRLVLYTNDGTLHMYNQILAPIMPVLNERYAGKLSLYFLSLKPDLKEYEESLDVHYVPHMSFPEFKKFMVTENFDIGLAPLVNAGFSKYKYFNKYIEYTLAGIPAIYSDCELYRLVVNNGENGLLCENTTEAWLEAITSLVENPEYRQRIANNAQEYAVNNFGQDKLFEKLIQDLPELFTYHSPEAHIPDWELKVIRCWYMLFRVGGWCHTAYGYLRQGKFKEMMARLKSRLVG